MTIPRNHHFVSQVLIKKFLGKNKMLYTYSKKDKCIIEKLYHRFDFAKKDLNSVLDDNNKVDHKSIEDNLNKRFESGFNEHYELLLKGLKDNDHGNLEASIKYIVKMGIIGDMRTPENILETKYSILNDLGQIISHFSDDLSIGFKTYVEKNSAYKNINSVNYNEICDKVTELMGETIYSICYAPEDNYFFLPDNSSVQIRSKRETIRKLPNGKTGINNITPITTIIIPVNSHILIIAESLEISPRSKNTLNQLSKEDLILFNNLFIKHSRDKVICSNKEYLTNFINQYVNT